MHVSINIEIGIIINFETNQNNDNANYNLPLKQITQIDENIKRS